MPQPSPDVDPLFDDLWQDWPAEAVQMPASSKRSAGPGRSTHRCNGSGWSCSPVAWIHRDARSPVTVRSGWSASRLAR